MANMNTCVIIGNTVTAICSGGNCMLNAADNFQPFPATALTISGTLTTTNAIMANWSREMWQSVVNRVVRMLASGPFAANFFSAVATVT
uniref:Pepsin-I3 domain-containing protein n=1 Tax=Angiostrongylus cantonensis TaxID=6313 RepID=A0A0K0DNC5_ANGCA